MQSIPITGLHCWFPLVGQDLSKAKERGEIKLLLTLSAETEVQLSPQQGYKQYDRVLQTLVEEEIRINPVNTDLHTIYIAICEDGTFIGFKRAQEWQGHLSKAATMILRQFATRRRLGAVATDVCLWSVYSNVLQKRNVDFGVVYAILQRLEIFLRDERLTGRLLEIFWTSARRFVDGAFVHIRHVRDRCIDESPDNFTTLLR